MGSGRRAVARVGAILAALLIVGTVPALAAVVRGTPDDDRLVGGKRADTVAGRGGEDRVNGKQGRDLVKGGPGGDVVIGGSGYDELRGDAGDDAIRARDGEPDLIDCGPGIDRVVVDESEDGVFDCEDVIEP